MLNWQLREGQFKQVISLFVSNCNKVTLLNNHSEADSPYSNNILSGLYPNSFLFGANGG